jgi:peroxiredoxin
MTRKRLVAGEQFSPIDARNIHGKEVSVPTSGSWVHLQFRRFAACPVCNLHLQSFVRRHGELSNAGIKEVVVFHSTNAELLPYQGQFPFDVVGDPTKALYRRYGVESSMSSLFNPGAWSAVVKGNLAKDKPAMALMPTGGILGLPADFLIAPDGTVGAAHYGKHADDQWSVDEVIDMTHSFAERSSV